LKTNSLLLLLLFTALGVYSQQIPDGDGTLFIEVLDHTGLEIKGDNPGAPRIRIRLPGDADIFSNYGEYLELTSGTSLNLPPGPYRIETMYMPGPMYRKEIVEVKKGETTYVQINKLGRLDIKAYDGVGKEISIQVAIFSDKSENLSTSSLTSIELLENVDYEIWFLYPNRKPSSFIIDNIRTNHNMPKLVESRNIGRLKVEAMNSFQQGENIAITVTKGDELMGKLVPGGHLDLSPGEYRISCNFGGSDNLIQTAVVQAGIEKVITFKSPEGSLEVQLSSGFGGPAVAKIEILKDGKLIKVVGDGDKTILTPGGYSLNIVHSKIYKITRNINIEAAKLRVEKVDLELGQLEVIAKDIYGKDLNRYCKVSSLESDEFILAPSGQRTLLGPGNYFVKYEDPDSKEFKDMTFSLQPSQIETFDIGSNGYGRLSWKYPELQRGSVEASIYLGKEKVAFRDRTSFVELKPEIYRGEFKLDNGEVIIRNNLKIRKGEELSIDLDLGKGSLEWTGNDFEGKELEVNSVILKTAKGQNFVRSGTDKINLKKGSYKVLYYFRNGVTQWRDITIEEGANKDIIDNLGRLYFDIHNSYGKKTSFVVGIHHGGLNLNYFRDSEYLDLMPGNYNLEVNIIESDTEGETRMANVAIVGGKRDTLSIGNDAGAIKLIYKDVKGKNKKVHFSIFNKPESVIFKDGYSEESIKVPPGEYRITVGVTEKDDIVDWMEKIVVKSGEETLITMQDEKVPIRFHTEDAMTKPIDIEVEILSESTFIKKVNSSEPQLMDPDTYTFKFQYPGPQEITLDQVEISPGREKLVEMIPDMGRLIWELKDEEGEVLYPNVTIERNETGQNMNPKEDYLDLISGSYSATFSHTRGLDTLVKDIHIEKQKEHNVLLGLSYGQVNVTVLDGLGNPVEMQVFIDQDGIQLDKILTGRNAKLPIGDYSAAASFSASKHLPNINENGDPVHSYSFAELFKVSHNEVEEITIQVPPGYLQVSTLPFPGINETAVEEKERSHLDGLLFNNAKYKDGENEHVIFWDSDLKSTVLFGAHRFVFENLGLDTLLNVPRRETKLFSITYGAVKIEIKNGMGVETNDIDGILTAKGGYTIDLITSKELTQVPPGEYTLRLKLKGNSGSNGPDIILPEITDIVVQPGKLKTIEIDLLSAVHFEIISENNQKEDYDIEIFRSQEKFLSAKNRDTIALPPGEYSARLEHNGEILERDIFLGYSEIKKVTFSLKDEKMGQVHMKAFDKEGEEIKYFVRIKQGDKAIKSVDGMGLIEDLEAGKYKLLFLVDREDIEKDIEIKAGELTPVEVRLSELEEKEPDVPDVVESDEEEPDEPVAEQPNEIVPVIPEPEGIPEGMGRMHLLAYDGVGKKTSTDVFIYKAGTKEEIKHFYGTYPDQFPLGLPYDAEPGVYDVVFTPGPLWDEYKGVPVIEGKVTPVVSSGYGILKVTLKENVSPWIDVFQASDDKHNFLHTYNGFEVNLPPGSFIVTYALGDDNRKVTVQIQSGLVTKVDF
jgi:hypothetical protein